MKKYSILIVGLKCYGGHIREFIVNLKKKNPAVEISLLTTGIKDDYIKDIKQSVDQLIVLKQWNRMIFPYFSGLLNKVYYYLFFLKLHFRGHFDIVDIHYPTPFVKQAMPILKRMTENIVITPWGSDVLRVENENIIKDLTKIYSQAYYITVERESQMGQCLVTKFKVHPSKMVTLGWGGEFFDYIQEHSNNITTEEAKIRFGLDGRYVITCGYNTRQAQRHEDILNAISSVRNQLPHNLTILIPCTYVSYDSLSEQKRRYVELLEERGKKLGLDVKVVREHLDLKDLLKLRMATDIFVHVQSSDAGSRCVMEYVFCNKKIVHGAWIKYAYLEEYKPSCYFPVERMEDLGAVILKASQTQIGDLPQEVKAIISERGWNHKMAQWNSFFESLIS